MSFHRRVRTIYRKELIDILRDRRTLIAMILVPILLYPLLLIGSVQAVSYQAESLGEEELIIGVLSPAHQRIVEGLIYADARELQRAKDAAEPTGAAPQPALRQMRDRAAKGSFQEEDDAEAEPIKQFRVDVLETVEKISAAVQERAVHVGVVFETEQLIDDAGVRNPVTFYADLEEVRSRNAKSQLTDLLRRTSMRIERARLRAERLPESFARPFVVDVEDLSSPPSILGQVLPLILVLMTITGAIYPAIDLTAGERERGTLESLMVCPVPVMDLIVGKFLVVTTVAIMGATLNLASVSATVYFGGFKQVIASQSGGVPLKEMGLILLCLVPFAVLMSAIMIAVCAYARTFKEAQNYVTPVIIAVLLPGGIAAMPTTRLDGVMLVMPVGNMVLLARELLIGASVEFWQAGMVLLSTTLYAAAAVGVAAHVFGLESVVFADSGSLKAMFSRRLTSPRRVPSAAMALAIVALLFPTWFFIQSAATPKHSGDTMILLRVTAVLMPLLFVIVPLAALAYFKVNLAESLSLRSPGPRYVLAAILLGAAAWVPAHELHVFQTHVLPLPEYMLKNLKQFEEAIRSMSPAMALLVLALIPAICEELLFRGVLLSGLLPSVRPAAAIIISAVIFGVFHFLLFKLAVTAGLGVVLALLCWRSRSIWPGMLMHALHNGLSVASLYWPWRAAIGAAADDDSLGHLPIGVILGGLAVFAFGLALAAVGPAKPHTLTATHRDPLAAPASADAVT